MSSCQHCGTSLSISARFCKNCGKPTGSTSGDASSPRASNTAVSGNSRIAISSTLFITSQAMAQTLRSALESKGAKPLAVVSDINPANLQAKAKLALNTQRTKGLKYICLVGNWDEVPPYVVSAPEGVNDGDEFCRTDALYGCINNYDEDDIFSAIPDFPVGRIPSANIDVVCNALLNSTELVDAEGLFLFGVSAEEWNEATETIISHFMKGSVEPDLIEEPEEVQEIPSASVLSSPDWYEEHLRDKTISGISKPHGIILFNVHGGADEPYWVGQRGGDYPKIFEPGTVSSFNSSTIVCEACYGGALGYEDPSVVEHFFEHGGHTFVGSSTIAYGSCNSNIGAADLLALHFLNGLSQGMSTGEALNFAKLEVISEDPLYDFIGKKTVLSFNLFGAPWHTRRKTRTVSRPREVSTQSGESLLDQIRNRRTPLISSANNPLDAIREQYRSRLPEGAKRFLIEKEEALKTIRGFADFDRIEDEVSEWGGDFEEISLNFFSNDDEDGYCLFSEAFGFKNTKKTMILLIDAQGNLKKTLTSKGI